MSYHKANALGTGDVDRYYIYKNSFDNLIAIKYKKKYDETKKNEYGISPLECYIAEVYIDVEEAEVNKKNCAEEYLDYGYKEGKCSDSPKYIIKETHPLEYKIYKKKSFLFFKKYELYKEY